MGKNEMSDVLKMMEKKVPNLVDNHKDTWGALEKILSLSSELAEVGGSFFKRLEAIEGLDLSHLLIDEEWWKLVTIGLIGIGNNIETKCNRLRILQEVVPIPPSQDNKNTDQQAEASPPNIIP